MTPSTLDPDLEEALAWCTSVVGPCEIASGDRRFHGRTLVCRLHTASGSCYLKIHRERSFWENEVHSHGQWAPAFGAFAPRLLAVHEDEPLALLTSELPGTVLQKVQLAHEQEQRVWHDAGRALAGLHRLARGTCFGPYTGDAACTKPAARDAVAYVTAEIDRLVEAGLRGNYLDAREQAIVRTVQGLVSALEGEPPVPCHRDYGPDNWLVTEEGAWSGVIDFEFAHWDVRVDDFARYPNWEWIERPELLEAFFQGYGRSLTSREEKQCLVARTQYALSAIVWGRENAFYGFEAEGRRAIEHIGGLMG
jgi:aminoglycoside phosphotransferase